MSFKKGLQTAVLFFSLLIILFPVITMQSAFAQENLCNACKKNGVIQSYEKPFPFDVYLPWNYEKLGPFPSLYLFHGQEQDESIWNLIGIKKVLDTGISEGSLVPMIVIMPREEVNSIDMSVSTFGTDFISLFFPYIEEAFNTIHDRSARAAGGISRGALWAQETVFTHTDLFSILGQHSPPNSFYSSESLSFYIHETEENRLKIRIDIGVDDPYLPGAVELSNNLIFTKEPHIFIVNEGAHDKEYWEKHLIEAIRWYSQCFTSVN